jgi:hypothetical protein
VTLALPIVLLSVSTAITPRPDLMIVTALLEAVFYFYAAGSLIAYMLQDRDVAPDELAAAGATFTLLAWAFAYLFVACQGIVPGSFGYATVGVARTWTELLYLSVAVLSSVGLSDIIPMAPMARALVMLESVAGIMYITLVVSRLINLTGQARKERSSL